MASPTVDKYEYGIMHVIRNSFFSQNYHYSNYWDVVAVETVRNLDLEEQFQEKRKDLIHIRRTKDELIERLLMGCYTKDEDIKFISLNGLQCGKHGTTSYLGNGTKGVTLGKHADILLKSFYNDGYEQCWIVVYKVVCGRQKEVLHIQTPPYREPMQDADCHVSILAPVPAEDCLLIQDIKAQVFMFDKDENGDFLRRPRQCVPIACVKFKRASPIGGETTTKAANRTISEISIGGNTKDSFTLLKDSLAKMKESFVLLSKETVLNSKTNHANPSITSKVPVNTPHGHRQQSQPELNKRTIKSETHKKDELDKRKSTASANTERVKEVDLCSDSATDNEPYDLEPTGTASSKKRVKKVSRTQREISKDRKLKPASVNVSISDERSSALSTTLCKVTAGISAKETEKTDSSSTKKRGQLPEPVPRNGVKEPLARTSSAEALSRGHRRDSGKCPSRTHVPTTGGGTVGKEIISGTDKKPQNAGSHLMPVVSNRKTRLIDALPVCSLSADPSLTSAFSRRPSVVVTAASNEAPKPSKSILRNPMSTAQNGSSVSTLTSSASGLQNCSNVSSRMTTIPLDRQTQPNGDSEAQTKNILRLVAPKQTNNAGQTSGNTAYKPKERWTLNSNCNAQNNQPTPGIEGRSIFHIPTSSPLEANLLFHIPVPTSSPLEASLLFHSPTSSPLEAKPLFHISTSSPLEAKPLFHIPTSSLLGSKPVSIISTSCSTSAVESNAKTALKTCLATSLVSTSIASVSRSKNSSSKHKEPTSNFVSQNKPSVSVQTSGTSETRPTQGKTSQRAPTNSTTLVPAKTHNDPVSFGQNQIKPASAKTTCISPKTGTEIVSPVLPCVTTAQKHPYSAKSSTEHRTIAQSKTIQSTKTEPRSKCQPPSPSLNGNFTSTCSNYDANRATSQPQNTDLSPALKRESGVEPILRSVPDNCLTKDGSKCKTNVTDIQLDAPPTVAIPQKKLLLLQNGFISSITKQLAVDLNDVANLLRSSKPEKVNHREKQALLSLREINSKFTELTPICVQYKQLFRHLKDGDPVRLPELDQLYSQEYTMNECCNVLGRVFSELKTSQLKSETVLQKRALAITWLVDSKNELISCINNIKSIVENVVLTCELRSVQSTKSSSSTPEANCVGSKRALQTGKDLESKGSSAASQNVVQDKLRSPVRCQDLGQVTKAMATERSSQKDRTPNIHGTAETKSQPLPEINESAATVSNVDHMVNLARSHSEGESSRSTFQNAEVTLPVCNGSGDAINEPDKNRETTHLQSETSITSDIVTEGYSEQNRKGKEPNTSECPTISAVEKSSQEAEAEKQAGRDISRSSAVCTVSRDSSQSSGDSNSVGGGALVSPEGGITSVAEHPPILTAVVANDPSNVLHRPIKTEHSDPPTLTARPPGTIILGADDFIPPSIPTPSDNHTSSIVQSASKGRKSVNNNDSPLAEFSCDIETSSVVRLEEGGEKQDGHCRYESCVSIDSKSSILRRDSLDDIPPLLTPDCAFDYSSIVYNVKSDEPPILEMNRPMIVDETSRNTENFGSTSGATPRDSPTLALAHRNSPFLVVTPRDSPPLAVTERNSPVLVVTPRDSPPLAVTERNSPLLVVTPRDSPPLAVTERNSPLLVVTPRDSPPLAVTERNSPLLVVTPRDSPPLAVTERNSPLLVVTPRDSPPLSVTERNSPLLVVTPRDSPPLAVTERNSPPLVVTPIDLPTIDVPRRNSSTDASDLVLLISGTRASTIIMNSDDMVASGSPPSNTKIRTDDEEGSVGIDTRDGENVKQKVEQGVPTEIQMNGSLQDDLQLAVVKETDEENDKSEGNYYVRVVGELTHVDGMALEKDIDAQSSMICQDQSLRNPMTRFLPDSLQPIQDDSKEKSCTRTDISYNQGVKSDLLNRPDDMLKTDLEVYLRPSPPHSIISHEPLTTDLSTPNVNGDQMQLKSDQTLVEIASSMYTSAPHYGKGYTAILSGGVRICGSNQSHYVFKIEPDDDFDPDPVYSYDSPKATEQPSASAPQGLLEVNTGREDQVSHQVYELDSSKPDDATSLLDRNIAQEPQVSSNSSTETLETVVCKSPCSTLLQDLESQSTSKSRPYESDNLNNEHETVSKSLSGQEHTNEISTVLHSSEPATHICQTGVLPLRLSSSESVPTEVPGGVSSESQEANSPREVQRQSVSQQMPPSSSPVMREESFSRHTLSDDRCFSPPTVYTEPPQSPPPETIPLTAVIKQEITDDLDGLVEMKRYLIPRTRRKRKRENKQNQEKPIFVISDEEGDESGCSAPPQKQLCSEWSIQSFSKGADRELRDSITRVVEFCSSDTYGSASGKPIRAKAKREFADRHHVDAVAETAAAAVEDKLMDGHGTIRPKMTTVYLSSKRQMEDDGKTNDERGYRGKEKHRSRRCSTNRNLSYDRDSVSSGSRIRDTHTERHTERRTSRDSAGWRTTHRSSDDQKERISTRLSGGSHESLRERRYRDEEGRSKASTMNGRGLDERSRSRRPDIDMRPRDSRRRSEDRSNYRSRSHKCSPTEYEDQRMRSRSTRPMAAAAPRLFETRPYDIRKDPLPGDSDQGLRTFVDPSTLKRQFWSKGHPRFKCHEGCDNACAAAPPAPQDADKRHRCGAGGSSGSGADTVQRTGNSSLVQDMDFLEETLKLNLEMLESGKIDDGEMESPGNDSMVPVRRGSKRPPLPQPTDGIATRRRKNDANDYETEAKEEEMEGYQSTASSRRSKTLSRRDKNSDCEDGVSNGLRTIYDEVDVADRYSLNKMTSSSTDDTERGVLQPSRCGVGSSVASVGSGSDGRLSREFGDDETQSLKGGISMIRMSKSTLHTCRQMVGSASATANPSNAAAATSVNLLRTSVTYVTEILQTSNFSTQVCIEKYKIVN